MSIKTYPGPKDDLWGVAWGSVAADVMITALQSGITTEVDVTGGSITWNAVAGRKYELSMFCPVRNNTVNSQTIVKITDSANAQVVAAAIFPVVANSTETCNAMMTLTGLASGSVTYKLRAVANAGTMVIQASATNPCMLSVKDIGPA